MTLLKPKLAEAAVGRGLLGLVLLAGCNSAVDVSGGSSGTAETEALPTTSTTSGSTSTTGTAPTTGATVDPETVTATSPATSAGTNTTSTSDATSSGGESSSSGRVCDGCGRPYAVAFDEDINGESASTVLPEFASASFEVTWTALTAAPPPTMATLTVTYEQGDIIYAPGGDNSCSFLIDPCELGYDLNVSARIVTADGLLDATFDGEMYLPANRSPYPRADLSTEQLMLDQVVGTLDEFEVEEDGATVTLEAVRLAVDWSEDQELARVDVGGYSTERGYVSLGSFSAL